MYYLRYYYQFFLFLIFNQFLFSKSYFYIYEWPNEITNRWPFAYTHHTLSMTKESSQNNGLGQLLNISQGLYSTHQYTLYTIFYNKLLISKYRTYDPKNASIFFIPYDLGMDSTARQSDGALYRTNCPMMSKVYELLQKSIYFQLKNGTNHFIIHSINQPMYYFTHLKCLKIYELCYNCMKLSIDTYSKGIFNVIDKYEYLSHNWLSIPFPSNYHYNSQTKIFLWKLENTINNNYIINKEKTIEIKNEMTNKINILNNTINISKKRYIIAFIGTIDITSKIQKQLRIQLINECLLINNNNTNNNCYLNSNIKHNSNTLNNNNIHIYQNSRFCLQPGGDFPTRKGFLDSLLSGCIPIIFQSISAIKQWNIHWITINNALNCCIIINRNYVLNNTNKFYNYIINLNNNITFLYEKYKCMNNIGFRMQYNAIEDINSVNSLSDEMNTDAFNITLQYLLK